MRPTSPEDLTTQLSAELDRLEIACRPIVMMTPWEIGAVTAYLFPSDPVTLIDGGVNTPEGWDAISSAFAAEDLAPKDAKRIIVTHAHTDHFGGAALIQEASGCEVLLHPLDIAICDPTAWQHTNREIFLPLGFTEEMIGSFWGGSDDDDEPGFEWKVPSFEPVEDGARFDTGAARLRIEHHAGHSPGHVWVVDDTSGAIFVGDYILGDHPTNAGLEVDRSHPTGRSPLLTGYNAGLRELMARQAPVLFPAHGPPIADHADLIGRRLEKTDRRTRHVADALSARPQSALDVGRHLYGTRAESSWEMMADLVGRLDLLVTEGRATSRLGEDGVWYFEAV
jgi:glyoxylase-like metal-dependent hydrolase (beta-lactamase superfamily II)